MGKFVRGALPLLFSLCCLAGPARCQSFGDYPPHTLAGMGFLDTARISCNAAQFRLPELTRIAEIIAARHIAGGKIGYVGSGQSLPSELQGRAGGMMNTGFGNSWEANRSPAEDAQNVAICGWDHTPAPQDLTELQKLKAAGTFIVGFGYAQMPGVRPYADLCDEWIETNPNAGSLSTARISRSDMERTAPLDNMLNAWVLVAETVGALTRKGKMPPMFKSYMVPGAHDWSDKYRNKIQFHNDLTVPPVPAGQLGKAYINAIRMNIDRLETPLMMALPRTVQTILREQSLGKKTVIAYIGHAPGSYLGRNEDAVWADPVALETPSFSVSTKYMRTTPDEAYVVRLGYTGLDAIFADAFELKHQKVLLITTPNPDQDKQIPAGMDVLDMGWSFGDAAVDLPGYPTKILPPSGVMQEIIYQAIAKQVKRELDDKAAALIKRPPYISRAGGGLR
jgi:uncharacterized phosphosugar-binding protein